jgi:cobalt-zinc-cadmium efflux system membrane fusion protein
MTFARAGSLVLVLVLLLGCTKPSSGGASRETPAPPASVTNAERSVTISPDLLRSGRVSVAAAGVAAPHDDLVVTGEISAPPDGAAEVGSPVSGVVREILAKEGDRVTKGQRLAVLEAAEAARTAADLGRAEARRERARRVLEQEEELMRGNATSARNLAEAKSELAASEAEVRGASSLLTAFGAAGGGRIVAKSPIEGTVVARAVVLGAPVSAGARLFRIVNGQKLLVRADVPENDAADIHESSEAGLAWTARGVSCKGVVESRSPSVDPMTRTVPFRVRPEATCPELVEGGFVEVTLPRPPAGGQTLVVVPRDALVELDAVPVVFVGTPNAAQFRAVAVRVARVTSGNAYLEDGVKAGEPVVVRGAILLKGELMRAALE